MASPSTDAVNDLITKIRTVDSVSTSVAHIFDVDDMCDASEKFGVPAVGVVYVGMRSRPDSSKTGLSVDLMIDIYIIGGKQCEDKTADLKAPTTQILDDIRKAIACTTLNRVGAQRKWAFEFEVPAEITPEVIGYVQRWKTPVILTNC